MQFALSIIPIPTHIYRKGKPIEIGSANGGSITSKQGLKPRARYEVEETTILKNFLWRKLKQVNEWVLPPMMHMPQLNSVLRIYNIGPADTGQYACTAENRAAETTNATYIHVYGRFSWFLFSLTHLSLLSLGVFTPVSSSENILFFPPVEFL